MGIELKGKYLKPLQDYFGSEEFYDINDGCRYDDALDRVVESVARVYSEYLTEPAAYRVMYHAVCDVEDWYRARMEEGREFSDQEIRELVISRIVDEFATYPRKYELTVRLPNMKKFASCDFHLTAGVQVIPERFSIKLNGDAAEIKLIVHGHCDPALGSDSVAAGLRELKIFAYLMEWSRLGNFFHVLTPAAATLLDFHSNESVDVILPRELGLLLGSLRPSVAPLVLTGSTNRLDEVRSRAREIFEKIGALIETLASPENESLSTAIEWLMDSLRVENQTVAMLEVCIGLEALLGEQGQMNDMSNRLCDRLAFLLGKNRQDRDSLSAKYRDILGLRGKLVHSKKSRLSPADHGTLNSARDLLGQVIRHELELIR